MDYEEQKRFKENKVKGVFLQNAKMDITPLPILTSPHLTAYRNKVQVPVQTDKGKVKMGFYRGHTNDIAEFDYCMVQTDRSNEIVQFLRRKLASLKCSSVFRHVLIKHAHRTNQIMVCFVVREHPFRNEERLVSELTEAFPEIRSVSCIIKNCSAAGFVSVPDRFIRSTRIQPKSCIPRRLNMQGLPELKR